MNQNKHKNEVKASELLWKLNENKAKKEGNHAKVYWVKAQKKCEDGSNHRNQWKFSHCYQGNWENNIKNGFGVQFYENGDKYEGEWSNNCRNGFGTYWIKNDKKKLVRSFTGRYFNDQKHGKGTMFFDNGNRYDGHWEKNEITGFGRMIYSNGDMYIGDWFENKRHGYGVFAKVNGDYYEGNWLLDQREGYGTYLFSVNNKIIIGEWSNDMPKTSVLYRLNEEEKDKELNSKGGLLKSTLLKKRLQTDINDLNIRLDNLLLPVLQLENPVEVLEEALNDVKKSRLGFRIRHSPIESLLSELELTQQAERFASIACANQTSNFEDVAKMIQFDSDEDLLRTLKEIEANPKEIYFEDFVKVVVYQDKLGLLK